MRRRHVLCGEDVRQLLGCLSASILDLESISKFTLISFIHSFISRFIMSQQSTHFSPSMHYFLQILLDFLYFYISIKSFSLFDFKFLSLFYLYFVQDIFFRPMQEISNYQFKPKVYMQLYCERLALRMVHNYVHIMQTTNQGMKSLKIIYVQESERLFHLMWFLN